MPMAAPSGAQALADRGVLITRPRAQAESLAARIADMGGHPILLPAIEIAGTSDPARLDELIARLGDYDMVIFVSPNAVDAALPLFRARQPMWPGACRVAAVGKGTQRALRARGIDNVFAPETASGASALLDTPWITAASPRNALIVRGEGGREELARGLAALGSRVDYAECYRRARPETDVSDILSQWRMGRVRAVIVTSSEILDNLIAILGAEGLPLLRATPVFTHHARIAEAARAHGIVTVIDSGSDEEGLVDALKEFFARHV